MKIEEKIALYLNEGRSKEVDINFAIDFIGKKCRKAATGTPIYRGNRKLDKDFYYVNPADFKDRVSPWADYNFYNLLFSNLPSWKKYPKRSKSVVATTSYYEAGNRNYRKTPYRVFPVDGSNIGVCPDWDIWDSFQDTLDNDLSDFNYILSTFLETASGYFEKPEILDYIDKDYPNFVRITKMIDALDKNGMNFYDVEKRDWLEKWVNNPKIPFIDYLNKLLDPTKNGFKIVKSGARIDDNKEVWTDGECLLVIDEMTMDLLEKIE